MFLVIIIALAAAGIYYKKNAIIGLLYPSSTPAVTPSNEPVILLDSDYEGIPDEIEKITGTDPNNWDTDGDGYSDAVELRNGYNPLGQGKLSGDDLVAIKEKIKNAYSDFYEKFFNNVSAADKEFSTPETALRAFTKAIETKDKDLFFKTINKNSLFVLEKDGMLKLPLLEMTKGLEYNFLDQEKYSLIDQNDKYAIMSPSKREIEGVKKIIAYDNQGTTINVTMNNRGNIYLNNEDGMWKIYIPLSQKELIYRNVDDVMKNYTEGQNEEIANLRIYWMSGMTNF